MIKLLILILIIAGQGCMDHKKTNKKNYKYQQSLKELTLLRTKSILRVPEFQHTKRRNFTVSSIFIPLKKIDKNVIIQYMLVI